MPDDAPSLHIDTDWKTQAREEKRRLAEQAKHREADAAAQRSARPAAAAASPTAGRATPGVPGRARPDASFPTLVQSMLTQTLYYLGELPTTAGEGAANLDLAKYHLDSLAVLEDKTAGNLDDAERGALDVALYEGRMRFVSTASRMIM